ncbi:MAG: VWA domain-containing protein [Spirochaetes bacterium]|nr:VWA domain-containing protein [Spirochaetota bacterium]
MPYSRKSIQLVTTALAILTVVVLTACATAKTPQTGAPVGTAQAGQSSPGAQQTMVEAAPSPSTSLKSAMTMGIGGQGVMPPAHPAYSQSFNTEEYAKITDNPFLETLGNPLSTFSIDVDTASYANVRRYLVENRSLPLPDAVRIEELVNYFPYAYAAPTGKDPVGYSLTMAKAPWNKDHELLRVAVKAAELDVESLPPSNLVFLLDCSGSMADDNKLPLLKEGLRILVRNLRPRDRVSIVAYAGRAGLVLPPTPGDKYDQIISAIDGLTAGGSTAGGEGIQLAYRTAKENYLRGGNNRVVLATDGDFNIGISSTSDLERYIEKQREENIYLTVLGLGLGNYKDNRMETLADKGNGNYAYIDNLLEAKKTLGKEIWGNLFTAAKDVKIQIEFNPALVRKYRLIGYEDRLLSKEDFNDDKKDAGEMGSGQSVTALYELVLSESAGGPKEEPGVKPSVDPLAFQDAEIKPSEDIVAFKLRYKVPKGGDEESVLVSSRLPKSVSAPMDKDFAFASAVAEFGMLLRDSPYKADASWKALIERARAAKGEDFEGYRAEFIRLAELAEILATK